jgi:hypothetical protein
MQSGFAKSIAAVALLSATFMASTAPASAQTRHHTKQHANQTYMRVVPADVPNIGPVPAATSPNWQADYFGYVPGRSYGYGPLPGVPQFGGAPQRFAQSDASCARFRSYDPASGSYLGRDGRRHICR